MVATADEHGGSNVICHPVVLPSYLWPHNFFYFSALMSIYMAVFYFPLLILTIPALILAVRVSINILHVL